MGIWHGLEWHFVVYGLYHALLIISFDKFERWNKSISFGQKINGRMPLVYLSRSMPYVLASISFQEIILTKGFLQIKPVQ